MRPLLFGLETEYSNSSTGGHTPEVVARYVCEDFQRRPHLLAADRGLFTPQGGRVYQDVGSHTEVTTPEVTDPWRLAAYDKGADRLIARALEGAPESMYVVKNNITYFGATYGSHESFLIDKDSPELLAEPLLSFLASRILYCGAGRLSFDPQGCGFEISQRSSHLVHVIGERTTEQRALFCTKNEPLSKYGRLHLIAGDSLMSETGTVLRFGTTALVVRMAELGLLAMAPCLQSPLRALHRFSMDPLCQVRVEGQTAIGLQRWYLSQATKFLRHEECPAWAAQLVDLWRTTLDTLEQDPQLLGHTLDWPLKLGLLRRRIDQLGLTWPETRDWGHVVFWLILPKLSTRVDLKGNEQSTREIFKGVLEDQVFERVEKFLGERRMRWAELYPKYQAICGLAEVCIRYHDVSPRGFFNQLEKKGLLRHQLLKEEEVLRAMTEPPPDTRARRRSLALAEIAASGKAARADWAAVWTDNKVLDLSDPFDSTSMEWSAIHEDHPLGARLRMNLRRLFEDDPAPSPPR